MTNEQLVWDYKKYTSVWEAEYAVKFPALLPAVLGTECIRKIAVISKNLVEIQYTNDICYRTAKGKDDISGDYNHYDEVKSFDNIAKYHGTTKGFHNKIFLATWTDDTYSYSIHIPHGVSKENIEELILSLAQVNSNGTIANAAMPNPTVEFNFIFEAEYAVKFPVAVPTTMGTSSIEHIYVISSKVVELQYKNDIIYRTARGNGDISGIYKTYSFVESFEENGFHVTGKGNTDLYYVSTWTNGSMTWSLYCPHGIHKKNLIALIHSMPQVDSCNFEDAEKASLNTHVGAYTLYHVVTEEETEIFNEAMATTIGVDYEPLLVATQLVAGINYRFVCNARALTLSSTPYLAEVTIFVPLPSATSQKPVCVTIKRLEF